MMKVKENTRRDPRTTSRLWTRCHAGQSTFLGEILDVSRKGAFFSPTVGISDWQLFWDNPPEAVVSEGEKVRLAIGLTDSEAELWLSGIVRWYGYHGRHGAYGLGIELDVPGELCQAAALSGREGSTVSAAGPFDA